MWHIRSGVGNLTFNSKVFCVEVYTGLGKFREVILPRITLQDNFFFKQILTAPGHQNGHFANLSMSKITLYFLDEIPKIIVIFDKITIVGVNGKTAADNKFYEWKVQSQSFLRNAISWIGYRNKSEGITAGHDDWNS